MSKRKKNTTRQRKQSIAPTAKKWWKTPQMAIGLTLILALTFIAYLPSLSNGFTFWDDNVYVTENPMIYALGWENIKAIFTQPVAANYHPVTMLSLAFNYQFSGIDAFGYHLSNLFLHLLNTILVAYFVWLLSKGKKWVVLTAAALFAIHPMHVESVAWVSERKDVLYTFFFLFGLIAYLQYRIKKTTKNYLLTFLFFTLSVFSKPAAVVFPLVLLLLDYWRYEQSKNPQKRWNWRKVILPKIPFFIVSLIIGIVTIQTQSEKAIGDVGTFSILQKIAFVSYGFVMYIIKAFAPFQLAAHYPYPDLSKSLPALYYLMPIGAISLLAISYYSRKYTKIIWLGMLFFLVNIILVLQFISVGSAIMADRYTYVPYIGLCIILGHGLNKLLQNSSNGKWMFLLAILYLLGLSYQTYERCKIWKSDETIWSDTLEKYPHSIIALNNRAAYYSQQDNLQLALADFNQTLQIKPNYFDALIGRSNLHRKLGNLNESLTDAQFAKTIQPNSERPYICMGGVYFQQGLYNKSFQVNDKALEINPNNADARLNRAILYSIDKDFQKSLTDFNKFIQLRPYDVRGYLYRGIAYSKLKQLDRALQDLSKAIQLAPSNGQAYLERARVHQIKGNAAQASKDQQKAKSLGFNVE